jgi:ribosomal protein L11 methyltransferase
MPKVHPDIWRIRLSVTLPAIELCEAALAPFAEVSSWFLEDPDADESDERSRWLLEGFARQAPDRVALETALALATACLGMAPPSLQIEQIPDTDWVLANLRDFPPIAAGRFYVHGSHYEGKPPAGRIALKVDAGAAFGSGEHATTRGCLLAIDGLLRRRRFRHPLDLGCGSGILAMALAKAAHVPVMAADIDPTAVAVARRNAAQNGVRPLLSAVVSPGYRHPAIRRHRPYDLIVANILARPLVAMAADLSRHLAKDGYAVLSGLLVRQERQVLAAHRLQGLSLVARLRVQGWSTLVLSRSPATAAVFSPGSQERHADNSSATPAAHPAAMAD